MTNLSVKLTELTNAPVDLFPLIISSPFIPSHKVYYQNGKNGDGYKSN